MACRWQEVWPVMRNAFVILHPGRKLISCDFSEMLPMGAGGAASRLGKNERKRQVDDAMRAFWFPCVQRRSWMRTGSVLERLGNGEGLSVRTSELFSPSPRTYCGVIWCYFWRAMKKRHELALNASLDATTFPRWNQSFMREAKGLANVCWRYAGFICIMI